MPITFDLYLTQLKDVQHQLDLRHSHVDGASNVWGGLGSYSIS